MKKNIFYIVILSIFCMTKVYSQIGINTAIVQEGVALQIEASDKGVLFPRIALSSRTSTSPLPSSIPTGTMVFNTVTAGSFPNTIIPGLHWWSAEEQQWINVNTNLENAVVKYTNSESTTNYNTTSWQNVKLFGNMIFNESTSIYNVNTTNQTVTIGRLGLYSISSLLSFDRSSGGSAGRVSLSARIFVNGNAVGTEVVMNPDYTSSVLSGRGLFSYSFTQYLELNEGDIVSVQIKKTDGIYSSGYGTSAVHFKQSGDSSIAILRIR